MPLISLHPTNNFVLFFAKIFGKKLMLYQGNRVILAYLWRKRYYLEKSPKELL